MELKFTSTLLLETVVHGYQNIPRSLSETALGLVLVKSHVAKFKYTVEGGLPKSTLPDYRLHVLCNCLLCTWLKSRLYIFKKLKDFMKQKPKMVPFNFNLLFTNVSVSDIIS